MGLGNILILTQTTGYVIVFLMTFFIFIPLSVNKAEFNNNCLLYSSGNWTDNTETHKRELDVVWGGSGYCNFSIFIGILSLPITLFYIAALSIQLFKNTEPSWLSAFLTLVVAGMGCFLTLVAACTVTVGYDQWCDVLRPEIPQCGFAEFINFKTDTDINHKYFAVEFGMAKFGLWVSWICWVVLTVCAAIQMVRYHKNEDFFISARRERERLIQRVHAPAAI